MRVDTSEFLGMHGLMRIQVHEDGRLVDERVTQNLMCSAGYNQLVASVVWSAAEDQNAAMGGTTPTQVLYPVYGAVGSASPTPAASDTKLGTELGRSTISEANHSGNQMILVFFYPTTSVPWVMTECGVFVSGSSTATSTANTGLLLNHAVFAGVTKTAAQTSTLFATFSWN
jgi:hypothetical protein